MRTVNVPEEIYEKAARMAADRNLSVDDFVSRALADQIAAREYLAHRAKRSSHESFLAALDQVPDVEPEQADRL